MPVVAHDKLLAIGEALLKGAGCSDYEAQCVAKGCISANLAGHDSHGIIAIPTYIAVSYTHLTLPTILPV